MAADKKQIVCTVEGGILRPSTVFDGDLAEYGEGSQLLLTVEQAPESKLATVKQKGALHLYFRLLAYALNAAGLDMKIVFSRMRKQGCVSWSEQSIKELWHVYQRSLTGKASTNRLDRCEVNTVYMEFDKAISELTGVTVEFPRDKDKKESKAS